MKKYLIIVGIVALVLIFLSYYGDISDENEKQRLFEESKKEKQAQAAEAASKPRQPEYPRLSLTVDEAAEDYNYMWQVLEDNYPYLRINYMDYREIKEKFSIMAAESLNQSLKIDVYQFRNTLINCLNEVSVAFSAQLVPREWYEYYYSVYRQTNRYSGIFTNENSKALYKSLGAKIEDDIFNMPLPTTDADDFPHTHVTPVIFNNLLCDIIDEKTAIVTVNTQGYGAEQLEYDEQKIMEFYTKIQDCENLIIDIRNIHGGNGYWLKLFVEPNITKKLTRNIYYFIKSGKENTDYYTKYASESLNGVEVVEDLSQFVNLDTSDPVMSGHVYKYSETISPASNKKMFSGNIYVLNNDFTYTSMGDRFVSFCKDTGFATIVGTGLKGEERLKNTLSFTTDKNLILLPKSGWIFMYSPSCELNGDGSLNIERGVEPDYPNNFRETPLETCLTKIAEKRRSLD